MRETTYLITLLLVLAGLETSYQDDSIPMELKDLCNESFVQSDSNKIQL